MQLIESRVKDMLHATQLANIKATRQGQRDYLDGQVTAFERVLREIAEITEEYIPGYCQGCVRIEMDKMDYGQVFPAFKAVASDDCEAHNGDNA